MLTDGDDYHVLAPAQDHKRLGDGDTGPNTGGMGAYAPAPIVDEGLMDIVCRAIVEPTLEGLAAEGRLYRGCLYVGIMVTPEGPTVVEFNCRFGDPEAQVVLPLVDADLLEIFVLLTEGRLGTVRMEALRTAAACVVMASGDIQEHIERAYPLRVLRKLPRCPAWMYSTPGRERTTRARSSLPVVACLP